MFLKGYPNGKRCNADYATVNSNMVGMLVVAWIKQFISQIFECQTDRDVRICSKITNRVLKQCVDKNGEKKEKQIFKTGLYVEQLKFLLRQYVELSLKLLNSDDLKFEFNVSKLTFLSRSINLLVEMSQRKSGLWINLNNSQTNTGHIYHCLVISCGSDRESIEELLRSSADFVDEFNFLKQYLHNYGNVVLNRCPTMKRWYDRNVRGRILSPVNLLTLIAICFTTAHEFIKMHGRGINKKLPRVDELNSSKKLFIGLAHSWICQFLKCDFQTDFKSKCMSYHFNFDAQVDLSEPHVYFDVGTTGASQCTDCSSMQKESFNVISNFAYGTKDGTITGYEGRKRCLKANISEDIRQTFLTVDDSLVKRYIGPDGRETETLTEQRNIKESQASHAVTRSEVRNGIREDRRDNDGNDVGACGDHSGDGDFDSSCKSSSSRKRKAKSKGKRPFKLQTVARTTLPNFTRQCTYEADSDDTDYTSDPSNISCPMPNTKKGKKVTSKRETCMNEQPISPSSAHHVSSSPPDLDEKLDKLLKEAFKADKPNIATASDTRITDVAPTNTTITPTTNTPTITNSSNSRVGIRGATSKMC